MARCIIQSIVIVMLLACGATDAADQGIFASFQSEGSVRPFKPLMRRQQRSGSSMVETQVVGPNDGNDDEDESGDNYGDMNGGDEDEDENGQGMSEADEQPVSTGEDEEPDTTGVSDEQPDDEDVVNGAGGDPQQLNNADEEDMSSSTPAANEEVEDEDRNVADQDQDTTSMDTTPGDQGQAANGAPPNMNMPEATAKIVSMGEKSKEVQQALTKAEEASKEAHDKAVQYQEAMKELNKEANSMIAEAINLRKTFHGELKTQVETLSQNFKTTADDIENADKAEQQQTAALVQTDGSTAVDNVETAEQDTVDDHHTHKNKAKKSDHTESKKNDKEVPKHSSKHSESHQHHGNSAKPKTAHAAVEKKRKEHTVTSSKHSHHEGPRVKH